jgi:hypothetical protein
MRTATTYLLVSFAVGCGTGVESAPGALLTDPAATSECDAPQGPLHHYTTAAEVETLILGRWRHCSGPALKPAAQAGIEFIDDHTFFALIDDNDGELVRMTGFDSEGTWRADQEGSWVQLSYLTPTGGFGGTPEFEDAPSRFSIRLQTDESAVYVRAAGP